MATQGSPAKFSYAIAERDDVSPWEPLHVGLGFAPEESVVTVYGGEAPHNVNDHVSTTAPGILNNVADVAATLGSNVGWYMNQSQLLVVLGPEHAATIAADGLTKSDVQRFVFEHARIPSDASSSAACGACTTGRPGCGRPRTTRYAAPGALGGRHLRDGGGRVGQALRRRAQLHVQPSGEPPHRPDSVSSSGGPPTSQGAGLARGFPRPSAGC